ncbi:hypothetical protein [Actinoplanes sp. NPDC026619]|uniref:hypothetical protein n=1 Tax=Actinoplanes sp. NPDC026619 TaxID=3155798 RepID=UPI0033E32D2F
MNRSMLWLTGGMTALFVAGCTTSDPTEPLFASPSVAAETPTPPTVSAEPAATGTKSIPADVPASAFLQAADAPEKARDQPKAADHSLPAFCKTSFEQKDQVGVRGTQLLLIQSKGDTEGSTPKSAVYEDVIVYRGDGATEFMSDLRAAVKSCASEKDDVGVTVKNFLRGPIGGGDDSELIERTRPATDDAGEPIDNQIHQVFWAAVRHGDTIAFVSNTGWESGGAEKGDTVTLGTRAAARVEKWRG